jgi:hypothetical protein
MEDDEIEPLVQLHLARDVASFTQKPLGREPERGGFHPPGDIPEIEPAGHFSIVTHCAHAPVIRR